MTNAQQWLEQGIAERERGALTAALESFAQALQLQPDFARAHSCRGAVLQDLGQPEAALTCFELALHYRPDYPQALGNAGNALCQLGRFSEGIARYDSALQYPGTAAESANLWFQRGNALRALGANAEAVESWERAIALQPDLAEAHCNRGLLLRDRGQLDAAIAAYLRALEYQPSMAQAQWNLSLAYLQQGDFQRGWPLYEARWRTPAYQADRPAAHYPEWDGVATLTGKALLLTSEQGLGDTLQFCRYASVLAARGAHVTLQVPHSLVTLLSRLANVTVVSALDSTQVHFDFQCSLLSVPALLQNPASCIPTHSIPATVPYLQSPSERQALWAEWLLGQQRQQNHATKHQHPRHQRPQIGLVWRGNALHPQSQQRDIPLADLLAALPTDCDYVSLQRPTPLPPAEQALLTQYGILEAGTALDDWADTAALCDVLDAIIGVDTAVMHLAGALGRPGCVLLPAVPDWRWQMDRNDSPWYPSLRLLRQTQAGDWQAPLSAIRALLAPTSDPTSQAAEFGRFVAAHRGQWSRLALAHPAAERR